MQKGQPLFDPTERLHSLKLSDPELGDVVERMCKALLATRGILIFYQCDAILQYVNKQLEPWVRMNAPFTQDERRLKFESKKGKSK